MTVTTPGAADQSREDQSSQTPDAQVATESQLGVSVGGDRCAVCGAGLAHDQRYCVECGTRRGAPRFSANLPSQRAGASAAVAERRSAARPSTMLVVLVVATLLIAFGVGLLVGRDALSKAPTVRVEVTGAGAGGSASGSGSHGSAGSAANSGSGGGSTGSGSSSGSGSNGGAPPRFQ